MTTFSLIDPQTDGRPRSRLCEIESTTHPKRSVDEERQVSRLIMTYLCKHLCISKLYQSTNCVGIQVLLNYNAYNSDKSSADVSVRLSVRIDCLASYFLLALCQRKFIIRLPRRQHKQTQQNKRHFNWALTTLAIWSVQVQVCACVCLGICGYLCQTVQGALVHFHWNTRNMSSQLPQLFPLYLCKYVNCIGMCVCVCGRGVAAVESFAVLCKTTISSALWDLLWSCQCGLMTINRVQLECFTLHQVRCLSNLQSGPRCRWGNYWQGQSQDKALKRLNYSSWIRCLFWYAW